MARKIRLMAQVSPEKNIWRFWFAICVSVLGLLFWVSLTVRSTQLSYAIQKLEKQINEEQGRQVQLEMERDRFISLDRVDALARKKLGMVVPKEENVVIMKSDGKE